MLVTEAVRFVTVPNPQGIHARPCFQVVQAANKYRAEVSIENSREGTIANAKSMVDLLTLNAPLGTRLKIIARGEDAEAAATEVAGVVASGFGEMPDGRGEVQ